MMSEIMKDGKLVPQVNLCDNDKSKQHVAIIMGIVSFRKS